MNCQLCQQEATTQTVEGYELCPDCAVKVQEYAQRLTARLERLERRADKDMQTYRQLHDQAHKMASAIPFGQPILVGHHSEGRDRRYRGRIESTYRKAFEHYEKAQRGQQRVQAAEDNTAISSDDPLAIPKLEARIKELQDLQAHMRAVNACIRQHAKKPYPEQVAALVQQFDLTEARASRLLEPDFLKRVGYPDYALTNNNSNIRRLTVRVEDLKRKQAAAATLVREELWGDVRLVRAPEDNRLRLHFPAKPDAATIKLLKAHGFVWSNFNKAWQRQLNNGAEYWATTILKQLGKPAPLVAEAPAEAAPMVEELPTVEVAEAAPVVEEAPPVEVSEVAATSVETDPPPALPLTDAQQFAAALAERFPTALTPGQCDVLGRAINTQYSHQQRVITVFRLGQRVYFEVRRQGVAEVKTLEVLDFTLEAVSYITQVHREATHPREELLTEAQLKALMLAIKGELPESIDPPKQLKLF